MTRKILRLAIPNIISNITIPLLGMVDLAIVGRMGDDYMLGGIAIGGAIFNFLYWNFGFLRMGTSGFASQAYGARNFAESERTLIRALVVALSIAITILVLQMPILRLSKIVLGGDTKAQVWAQEYFLIRIWAAPATLMLYSLKGWFIGMQNAKTPMWIAIVINVVNVVASLYFAFTLDMKIAGVALGTVIAQWSGLVMGLTIVWLRYAKIFRERLSLAMFKWRDMRRFFVVNSNIFVRTACLVVIATFFTAASAKMGNDILAANTLLLQLFTLFSYMMDGFAYSVEALSGRYWGSGNRPMLTRAVNTTLALGAILSIVVTIIYGLWGEYILMIFTESDNVLHAAKEFMIWVTAVPLAGFVAFLLDGVMVGISASAIMRNTMLGATAIFFICYYSLFGVIGNNALWIAFLLYLLMRGVIQFMLSFNLIYGRKIKWNRKL